MKAIPYKFILILLTTVFSINAQSKKENYKEEFKVKPDVIIDINTRHSDIEIETWSKNEVVVEAYMLVDGEAITEEMRNAFYDKWNFEVVGNSKEVKIKSRTNSRIDIHSFNFDAPDYSFLTDNLTDFSLGSLDILDSIDFITPPLPPEAPFFPEMPPLPPIPDLPSDFDFDAYKKDKGYLEKWKKENKDKLGENAKVKIGKNSISMTIDESSITMNQLKEKEQYKIEIAKAKEKYRKAQRKMMEENERLKREFKAERKKHMEERKKAFRKLAKERKESRKEIQKLLKNRSKLKIKRFIKIKAPKTAKFNMNVRYGALSFSK